MNRFEIGQEVYVIYRRKNSKGVNKWHPSEKPRKIIDKNNKYIFNEKPFKVKKMEVFDTYEKAKSQCEYRNHWGKYHDKHGNKIKRKKEDFKN